MKIKFLGTAAYDGMPTLFCNCPTCLRTRKEGGKSIRTRSQALVNDELLIDFNADTVAHFLHYGIDYDKVKNCIITHSHCDHLYPDDIVIAQYAANPMRVNYFSAKDGYEKICAALNENENNKKCGTATLITPFEIFNAGDYKILPLPADHAPDTSPVFYAIERGGKRMLYAHDTGVFKEEVFKPLKAFGRLDFISFDCTGALEKGWTRGHMCLETNLLMLDRLKKEGIADDNTKVAINHFSHNGNATHGELCAACKPYGVIVAYDGLEVEF